MKKNRFAVLYLAAGLSAAAASMSGCAACPGVKAAEPARPVRVVETRPEPVREPVRAGGAATIELTPLTDVNPVQTQHTFVATVRDANGNPVSGARVEWMLANGPQLTGDIVDVAGGKKIDNSYAVSTTGSGNTVLDRGTADTGDDIPLGPGQTWCTITSTVEGTSKVIAYAPEIKDWDRHKAFAEKNWMDVTWEWPVDATNRVGTPHTFTFRVMRASDGAPYAGYKVSYRLLSGPEGTLSTTSAVTDAQGVATVTLNQASPKTGTNEVEITVVRPAKKDDCVCYGEKMITTGVVRKTWVAPDLAIDKNAPATASKGDVFTYDIQVRNLANDLEIRNVTVTDPLPEGVEYVSSNPAATVSGSNLTWNLGTMPAGGVQNLQVSVRALREGRFENCATVTAENGSLSKKDCAETVVTAPSIKIVKYATPEVMICDPITYRIVVTNNGSGAANDVNLSDTLPQGVVTADGSSSVSWPAFSLAPGESREFSFNASAKSDGNFTNTATVTSGGAREQASASTVVKMCKLAIVKTAARNELAAGRPAEFSISVTNNGSAEAKDVVLEDQVPAGMTFSSATDGGMLSGGTVVWNLGTIPVGGSKSVKVTMSSATPGTYTNTATARAYCCDSVNSSANVAFKGISAVLLEVVDSPDPIEVGGQTTYTIDVTNQGDAPDTNIVITATLPPQEKFVSASSVEAQNVPFSVDGQKITFGAVGSLAPKARITYKVTVAAVTVGNVRFAVEMTTNETRSGGTINETESTTIY